ncbi:hypothetical protein ANN_01690 [Periplaneta americana]|uniref:Uncharacterized protein n=1 Tax=Periplaneta americana TaxID=6978 RepID=A0ABQ8TYC0_PERAM|nr:hypothetical protein ANN_01690 [Periplaneta americana]
MAGLCEGSNEPPGSLKAICKDIIEGGEFYPVLWIEFGVAQWSGRLVRSGEGKELKERKKQEHNRRGRTEIKGKNSEKKEEEENNKDKKKEM